MNENLSIPDRLRTAKYRTDLIAAVTTAFQQYQLALDQNHDQLHPDEALPRLSRQLESAAPADVPAIQAAIEKLTGEVGKALRSNAEAACRQKFLGTRGPLNDLFTADYNLLINWAAQAVEDEKTFFGGYGLAREATNVSRKFDNALAMLKQYRTDLNSIQAGVLPPAWHPYFQFAGISVAA